MNASSQSRTRKLLRPRFLTAFFCTAVLGWLVSSALVACFFVRRFGDPSPVASPNAAWAKIEEFRLKTNDGQKLGAWLVRGDESKSCVLLLHGNRGSRIDMIPVMQKLAEAGHTVLAVNFRAHGDSTGEYYSFGWNEKNDVIAATEYLEKEFPRRPIYIVGRSLGAASAILASSELKNRIAGYFLEQPFRDLSKAVRDRLSHFLPPVLDYVAYSGLCVWEPLSLPTSADQISPFNHITDIPENVPVVFITGSDDRHAPLADVSAMLNRIKSHAKLTVIEGAAHEPLDRVDPQRYYDELFRLVTPQ